MSFLDDVHSLIHDQQNPQPEFMANYRRLVQLNGSLGWRDMVQAVRLLILGAPVESERLAFLRELSPDRATGEMLAAAAAVLRDLAPDVPTTVEPLFDCCGTGGDKLGHFNISTLSGLTLGAMGVPIAKHGNRAITSHCGSADILEELGVPVDLSPAEAGRAIDEEGFAFLFAPQYHSATRNVQPLRKKLSEEGRPTLFNLLGPLSNPAMPTHQLVGVFHPDHLVKMAEALSLLDCSVAWVVSGEAGEGKWMDEISPSGPTRVIELREGILSQREFHPEEVGMDPVPIESLVGGGRSENRKIAESLMAGEPSPCLDAVALSSGVSLALVGKAESPVEGFTAARDFLQSGGLRPYVARITRVKAASLA